MGGFRSADVQQLLHNKYVVILGDSIQRSVYKDLVKFLQHDECLTEEELKKRGEFSFLNDVLIEGGQHEEMHNGTTYQEVRQYRSGHHLVRFYFLTRVYSTYLESILSDFQSGPQPDVLMINSCVWDVNRYGDQHLEGYKTNLHHLFLRLKEVLNPQCLILWTTTMPVGYKDNEVALRRTPHNVRMDMVEGNFFSATLADFHKVDVVDMHYHFRHDLPHRIHDSVHWDFLAHRKYSQILLSRIACAWGVQWCKKPRGSPLLPTPLHRFPLENDPRPMMSPPIHEWERSGPAPPPFADGSQQLIPPSRFPLPPGADFNLPLFSMMVAHMTFASFISDAPLPTEPWEMRLPPRKALRSRGFRRRPYR